MVAPSRWDIVWLDFNPAKGREQAGRRPALVLTSQAHNKITGLALVCPITSKIKGYPYEVELPATKKMERGAVLANQMRTVSWKERGAKRIEAAPPQIQAKVLEIIKTLIN